MFHTAEPLMRWHKANEQYLVNRQPVAAVGVVWSQRNTDFYGRNEAAELVDAPYRGLTQALIRARIPYIPVFADHIDRDALPLSVLALPAVGAMSDAAVRVGAAVRRARRRADRHRADVASTPSAAMRDRTSRWPISSARTRTALRRPAANAAHTYLRIASPARGPQGLRRHRHPGRSAARSKR